MFRSPLALVFAALSFTACQSAKAPESPAPAASVAQKLEDVTPNARAAVLASDRTDADRALDAGRKPAQLLTFIGVNSGMHVAEIGAGGGYTSELLARAVGPSGVVFGQNNKWILERFAEKPWSERLAKPANKNIVRVNREFDDPLPPQAKDLDAVVIVLLYHDLYWQKVDRAKMNKAIFSALRPGGVYVIVDHAGRDGTGSNEVQTLHRIEEKVVKEDVTAAGFRLIQEGDFLREPSDTKNWNASPMSAGERRGHSDRFVLKFARP